MVKKVAPKNSIQAATEAALAVASPPIRPPSHMTLRSQDEPYWVSIINSRARIEWSENDLVIAAQLARCQADIAEESERMERESSVIRNDRGTPIPNPRIAVIERLASRQLAYVRTLGMGGSAANKAAPSAKGLREAERTARGVARDVQGESESLLAGG